MPFLHSSVPQTLALHLLRARPGTNETKCRLPKVAGELQFIEKRKEAGDSSPEKVHQARTSVMSGSGPDDKEMFQVGGTASAKAPQKQTEYGPPWAHPAPWAAVFTVVYLGYHCLYRDHPHGLGAS